MKPLFLSLGSNIKPRLQNLIAAIILLEQEFGAVVKYSKIYETESWGNESLNLFYNLVLKLECNLDANEILNKIHVIEKSLGRNHKEHWQNRPIDIDIIFYDNLVLESEKLTIPHKLMHLRNFVLFPMADIDDNFLHPTLQKPIKELLLQCKDELKVKAKEF